MDDFAWVEFFAVVTLDKQEVILTGSLVRNSLEVIELSSVYKVSLVEIPFRRNTVSVRGDPEWTSSKNGL